MTHNTGRCAFIKRDNSLRPQALYARRARRIRVDAVRIVFLRVFLEPVEKIRPGRKIIHFY